MLGLGSSLTSVSSLGEDFGVNHSLLFDGTNDEVDFTSSGFQTALSASQGNFKNSGSVSIWARFENTGVNGQLWDFAIDTDNRIQLQYKQSTDSLTLTFKGDASSTTQRLATYDPGSGLEGDSTFHHIACTWDKSAEELKLYVDGTLRDTGDLTNIVIDGDFDDTPDGTTGASGNAGVEFMAGTSFTGAADLNGYLDDFAVYSTVLRASEVEALYNSGTSDQSNVNAQGEIIAHWTFNEGTGTTVTDRVNGFVGTLGSGGNAPTFSTNNAGG
jgi:hypothetical protein